MVEADGRLQRVLAEGAGELLLLHGVGQLADKVAVLVDAELLGGFVEADVAAVAAGADLARVNRADVLGGQVFAAVHHVAVNGVGGDVRDDVTGVEGAVRGLHADGRAVFHEDFGREGVVEDRAAMLADGPVHRGRKLVRAIAGDIRGVYDVLVQHGCIEAELQVLRVHAHVAPVGGEDLLRLQRHLQCPQHDRGRVVRAFEEVRVLLHHDLGIRLPAGCGHSRVRLHDAVGQVEELLHRFPAARDVFLHLVDVGLLPEGHDRVDPLLALAVDDQPVGLGDLYPVHLRTVGIDQGADLFPRAGLADVAQLVQGGLKLEAAAPEARGKAAGQVVLLDQQGFVSAVARGRRCRQTAVARADDDDVILPVQFTYLLFLRSFRSPAGELQTGFCPQYNKHRWTRQARYL